MTRAGYTKQCKTFHVIQKDKVLTKSTYESIGDRDRLRKFLEYY